MSQPRDTVTLSVWRGQTIVADCACAKIPTETPYAVTIKQVESGPHAGMWETHLCLPHMAPVLLSMFPDYQSARSATVALIETASQRVE